MAVGDQAGPAPKQGLPMWVIIGGVGAVVVFLWYRKKSAGSSETPALTTGVATDPNTGLPIDPLTGLPWTTTPPTPADNNSWANGALQWAEKHNIGAAAADQALFDYINGNALNATEADIINKILSGFGNPPNLLPFVGIPPSGNTNQHPGGTGGTKGGGHGAGKPKINAAAYPQFISAIKGPPLYRIPKGDQVVNGAPVYALVNTIYGPVYEQGQAVLNAIANGGQLFTLPQFRSDVSK